jgi:hypothetical protein
VDTSRSGRFKRRSLRGHLDRAFLASAQLLPMADPDICGTPVYGVGAEASFLVENDAAMRKMMSSMAVKPTGDERMALEIPPYATTRPPAQCGGDPGSRMRASSAPDAVVTRAPPG